MILEGWFIVFSCTEPVWCIRPPYSQAVGLETISAHVGVTNLDSVVVRLSAGECLEDSELQQ